MRAGDRKQGIYNWWPNQSVATYRLAGISRPLFIFNMKEEVVMWLRETKISFCMSLATNLP